MMGDWVNRKLSASAEADMSSTSQAATCMHCKSGNITETVKNSGGPLIENDLWLIELRRWMIFRSFSQNGAQHKCSAMSDAMADASICLSAKSLVRCM